MVELLVTIIVLIILSTISISAVFGENGLIQKSKETREHQANILASDQEDMDRLLEEYNNAMQSEVVTPPVETNTTTEPDVPTPDPTKPLDSELVTNAEIVDGMTPVKYVEGTGWVKTTLNDSEWYDYSQKKWANAVLGGATFNGNILNESKTYSMVVWIPRYAYKITSGWHSNPANGGDIDVVFIDTNDKDKSGTTYNAIYTNTISGVSANGSMKNHVVHPAFNFGTKKLAGIWVGKFESSHTDCTISATTGETSTDTTNLTMQIKAGITSWRNISVNNMFTVCRNLTSNSAYGLSTSGIDSHMMKNTEWGAVAYLSKSKYGKQTEEVWINNNNSYITGQAGTEASASGSSNTNAYDTTNGQKASTTGNVTGVYDMSGGAYDYTAAYLISSNASTNGTNVVNAAEQYKDEYETNYPSTKYGDAVYETSNSNGGDSWYQDEAEFPTPDYSSFFLRGGWYGATTRAGVFSFESNSIETVGGRSFVGFRVILSVIN